MQESYESHRELIERLYLSEKPNYCNLHFHSHFELVYALESGLLVSVNNKVYTLQAGEVAVIDSFAPHSYPNPLRLQSIVLVIPTRFCSEYMARTNSMQLSTNFITDHETCTEILQMIRLLQKHTHNVDGPRYLTTLYSPDEEAFVYGCIATIMGILLRKIPLVPRKQAKNNDLKKNILLYIEDHYGEEIHLDSMASYFGYSRYYFSKICNKLFGMSIVEYINRVRILKILEDDPQLTFTKLANKHGFTNIRTFQRAFKDVIGMSPSEYKRNKKRSK